MTLDEYLSKPRAPSVVAFARLVRVSSDQVRQWRYAHANRKPGPIHASRIEKVTKGAVKRWDLRPDDWYLIWPELIGAKGAPVFVEKADEV